MQPVTCNLHPCLTRNSSDSFSRSRPPQKRRWANSAPYPIKFAVKMLETLAEKTRGNLDFEEAEILGNAIQNLRSRLVN